MCDVIQIFIVNHPVYQPGWHRLNFGHQTIWILTLLSKGRKDRLFKNQSPRSCSPKSASRHLGPFFVQTPRVRSLTSRNVDVWCLFSLDLYRGSCLGAMSRKRCPLVAMFLISLMDLNGFECSKIPLKGGVPPKFAAKQYKAWIDTYWLYFVTRNWWVKQ